MRSIKEIKEQLTQATAQVATLDAVASRLDVFEKAERAVVEESLAGSKQDAERLIAKLQEELVDGQSAALLAPIGTGMAEILAKLVTEYPALRDSHGIQAAAYFKTPEDAEPTIVLSFRNRVSRVTRGGGNGGGKREITVDGTLYASAAVANRAFFGDDVTGANRASIEAKLIKAGHTVS